MLRNIEQSCSCFVSLSSGGCFWAELFEYEHGSPGRTVIRTSRTRTKENCTKLKQKEKEKKGAILIFNGARTDPSNQHQEAKRPQTLTHPETFRPSLNHVLKLGKGFNSV